MCVSLDVRCVYWDVYIRMCILEGKMIRNEYFSASDNGRIGKSAGCYERRESGLCMCVGDG